VWVLSIVWIAILERLKMVLVRKLVKLAVQDNIKLPQEMLRASNAPLVSVKTTKDKRRASNAALVNLAIPLVMPHVNHALPTPITVTKEETPGALIAQQVGRRKTAVRNVARAVRVRLALGVKIVHRVMQDMVPSLMRPNVNNVHWVKPQRRLVQRLVKIATRVHLA
jgi:uncharacterized protein YjeT (DUF2065 family)